MEKSTRLKVIGSLLSLWGLFRLGVSGLALVSSAQARIVVTGFHVVTGMALLAGGVGVVLRRQVGFYAGILGVLLVLGFNVYGFAAGTQGNIAAVLVVAVVGYYLYDSRGIFA